MPQKIQKRTLLRRAHSYVYISTSHNIQDRESPKCLCPPLMSEKKKRSRLQATIKIMTPCHLLQHG